MRYNILLKDAAAMRFHNGFAEREPEPHALSCVCYFFASIVKHFEQMRPIFLRNTAADTPEFAQLQEKLLASIAAAQVTAAQTNGATN